MARASKTQNILSLGICHCLSVCRRSFSCNYLLTVILGNYFMPGGICKENFNRCLSLSDFMQKLLYYGIEISQTITILLSSDDTL